MNVSFCIFYTSIHTLDAPLSHIIQGLVSQELSVCALFTTPFYALNTDMLSMLPVPFLSLCLVDPGSECSCFGENAALL
jgi:hypothetical protein